MISLKFVPEGPINNITALVQTMAWRLPGLTGYYLSMLFTMLVKGPRPQGRLQMF